MNIPKQEQLTAILEAKERDLAKKYGFIIPEEIPWKISTKEITKYIVKHGFPEGWVYFSEHPYDGIYLIKNGFYWTVSYKERGVFNYSKKFFSKRRAINYLLDEYFLRRIGIK